MNVYTFSPQRKFKELSQLFKVATFEQRDWRSEEREFYFHLLSTLFECSYIIVILKMKAGII
jgi:hypothetical protein